MTQCHLVLQALYVLLDHLHPCGGYRLHLHLMVHLGLLGLLGGGLLDLLGLLGSLGGLGGLDLRFSWWRLGLGRANGCEAQE